jgi:hypothetical protein
MQTFAAKKQLNTRLRFLKMTLYQECKYNLMFQKETGLDIIRLLYGDEYPLISWR